MRKTKQQNLTKCQVCDNAMNMSKCQKLTNKQKKFCREYVKDFNGTQAAIRAGYSEHTATEQASRLLINVKVGAFLAKLQAKIDEESEITVENIRKRLWEEANAVDENATQAGNIRALELLGKHVGMFTENFNIKGDVKTRIVREIVDNTKDTNG